MKLGSMKLTITTILAAALMTSCKHVALSNDDALAIIKIQAHINTIQKKATDDMEALRKKETAAVTGAQTSAAKAIESAPTPKRAAEIQKEADGKETAAHQDFNKAVSELLKKANEEAAPYFAQSKEIQDRVCKANKLPANCAIDVDKMTVMDKAPVTPPR